jgi:hypothetical protein
MSLSVETRKDRWRLIIVCDGDVDETPWAKHPGVHRMSDSNITDSMVYAAKRQLDQKGNGRGYGSQATALVGASIAQVALHENS